MDSRSTDRIDDQTVAETPEDVAVLYSWANLHGAKYRDFSASRREYRAQLRHRAAEQVREQALLAQAEAEAAAAAAESAARHAAQAALTHQAEDADSSMRRALREAEEAARTAAAERVEAARRAEAAAVAEAAARREEREIAEAHASAQRQAARYADSEIRRKALAADQNPSPEIPGKVTDPYTVYSTPPAGVPSQPLLRPSPEESAPQETASSTEKPSGNVAAPSEAPVPQRRTSDSHQIGIRRPQGYRPDEASGVRQIYRGPDYDAMQAEYTSTSPARHSVPVEGRALPLPAAFHPAEQATEQSIPTPTPSSNNNESQASLMGHRRNDSQPQAAHPSQAEPSTPSTPVTGGSWPPSSGDRPIAIDLSQDARRDITGNTSTPVPPVTRTLTTSGLTHSTASPRPVSPFSQALVPSDSTRGRRAQDDFDYQQSQGFPERRSSVPDAAPETSAFPSARPGFQADPAGPAWLYAPPASQLSPRSAVLPSPIQSSVADTLQHSRERVAARWFALKGVFEQPGQEQPEPAPVRQKETRTPVLAVFSLAGGVGKTSLVATVGRSLSSMGEKVLLTDTTSHGLLPFYFGASELRQGTVRTFSPPSGSTDAPIYLVSYDVDRKGSDDAAQEQLAEEIINNSRGMQRILLDLNVASSWIVRRLSRMNPTILVPVAPDMNSVISLQTVEKFFHDVNDGDGRPLMPFYVLNQFDTSLPLHLDVREVMRRQLGDRLLPFVIRRAPSVSEALAEGMTVVDYAPDAPVAEDYLNLATWLRTVAAPATAGFRNVRWSER